MINDNKANQFNTDNLPRSSCFIPTASAFGLPLTSANLFKSWISPSLYGHIPTPHDVRDTPFDALLVQSKNETHLFTSASTKNWIINQIQYGVGVEGIGIGNVSYSSAAGHVQSTISNPIRLEAKDITIAAKVQQDAGLIIKAGNSITGKTGFHAKSGSYVHAYHVMCQQVKGI